MHVLFNILQEYDNYMRHQRRLSRHTITGYTQDLHHFLTFLHHHLGEVITSQHLEILTLRDCRAWLAARHKDFDARSNARALASLRHVWRYLLAMNVITNDVFFLLKSPKIKKTLPRPLNQDQTDFLLQSIDTQASCMWVGLRDKALFMLLYATGLRISEALSLTQGDISNTSTSLRILGKGKKERLVPLLEEARQGILEYLQACPYTGRHLPLFLGIRGKCLQPALAAKILRDFRRLYNLPETLTPHALRHTCASHLMVSSKDLRGIQSLLGHASLNSTQVYTDLDMESLVNTYNNAHPRQKIG